MKVSKLNYFLPLLCMSSLVACNNEPTTGDKMDAPITTITTLKTNEIVEETTSKAPIDLTTIEGYWTTLKQAVATENKETLKQLTLPNVGTYALLEPDYQALIAKSELTDIKKSSRTEAGKSMYEFVMTMNYEGVAEMDQPTTTIFIWKNEAGNFEIFDIFEAG